MLVYCFVGNIWSTLVVDFIQEISWFMEGTKFSIIRWDYWQMFGIEFMSGSNFIEPLIKLLPGFYFKISQMVCFTQ